MSQSQKEAAEYAEVLLAYSRGENIQMRPIEINSTWGTLDYPLWEFGRFEYRIAPKPMEYWVALEKDHDGEFFVEAYTTKEAAIRRANNFNGRVALMREVTE